jgi:type VI secretion system secreted protein VgrG
VAFEAASVRLPTLSVELRCADAPQVGLLVRSMTLVEALDNDHRCELTVACHVEYDAATLLGADVELMLARGVETRRVLGIVDWLEDLGESNHLQFTRLRIVPAFTLLGLGRASRIWQHKSVRDILSELLEPGLQAYGRTFDFGSTTRGAQKRDYCVQYRESDRRFAQRLLEEEGIAFDFLHEGAVEQLVLRDANEQYPKFTNLDGTHEIPFIDHDADLATVESVQVLGRRRELTVTSVARRDYDWKHPRDLLDHEDAGSDERSRERRVYLHERRRYIHDDQPDQVGDELAAMQRSGAALEGRSNVSGLQAGQRFVLVDAGQNDGEYLVTRITHELRDDQSGGTYFNRFSCIPLAHTHRPRVSVPKPRVHGPHEIHTDEHGRIEVQFHWEEGPKYAAHSSCWMRCAQSWSSGGWGAQFIPRVGMEVVVEFLEGNPDRPLVTGCVYNGDNAFPFAVPANKTQSGWRTRSSPDSEGYNMLRFEDAAGREEIFIHGQKDWNIVIEHDKGQEVRHDETLHVFHDRTKTVDNNEHETIHKHRTIVVGLTHTETIGVNMALTVGINEVETVGVAKTVTVGQFLTTTVGKDMCTTVVENLSEGVGESKSSTVGVDKTVSVGSNYRIDVGEEFSIVCGDSSIVMKKDGTITIRGKTIDSETTEETNLRGKPIKLNCS